MDLDALERAPPRPTAPPRRPGPPGSPSAHDGGADGVRLRRPPGDVAVPHLKAEWGLVGQTRSVRAPVRWSLLTVALGGIPVALFADRVSRVRSIAAMAAVEPGDDLRMFTRNYAQLAEQRARSWGWARRATARLAPAHREPLRVARAAR